MHAVEFIGSMWANLQQLDVKIFSLINGIWRNSFFDVFLPFISDLRHFYLPLAIAWLFLVFKKSVKTRTIAVAILVLISFSESLSTEILKPIFDRPRPYDSLSQIHLYNRMEKNWQITPKLETVVTGQSRSMPSSHAVNIFSAAFFLSFFFRKLWPFFSVIAFLVGYSRIYLGVHYPSDVLAGAVVGILCGWLLAWLTTHMIEKFEKKTR
jgi:undecaprenyl-diphosphatase